MRRGVPERLSGICNSPVMRSFKLQLWPSRLCGCWDLRELGRTSSGLQFSLGLIIVAISVTLVDQVVSLFRLLPFRPNLAREILHIRPRFTPPLNSLAQRTRIMGMPSETESSEKSLTRVLLWWGFLEAPWTRPKFAKGSRNRRDRVGGTSGCP